MARALYRQIRASDFVHKVTETFATRIALIAIGLVTSVVVARILGPEGRGLYAVAITIGALGVQFGNLGLHAANTYLVAKDQSLLPELIGNTLLVGLGYGGVGAALVWLAMTLLPHYAPLQGGLLALALAWVPFGLTYMLLQNLLLGVQEVRAYNQIEITAKVLTVALLGLIIAAGMVAVETVFSAGLLALVVSCVWSLQRLRQLLPRRPWPSPALLQRNLSYGFKAYLAALFSFLVLRADLLMVEGFQGVEQAGYYAIAVTMADMVYMLPMIIGTLIFPRLSALRDAPAQRQLTTKTALLVGAIMLAFCGIAALLADPAVRLLYGAAFAPATAAFVWLMPGILLLSINTILMNYFAAIGMPLITVYSPGVAALVNIGLNLVFIPRFGMIGASLASSLCYGLMLVFSLLYLWKRR